MRRYFPLAATPTTVCTIPGHLNALADGVFARPVAITKAWLTIATGWLAAHCPDP
jgi:hypothetical protein